jgi:hypothetical protein
VGSAPGSAFAAGAGVEAASPASVGVPLSSPRGFGTVTLSKAAETRSSATEMGGVGAAGSVVVVVGSAAWAGTLGSADAEPSVDSGEETRSASCEGTVSRPLRERLNAFRRRERMPMCATLRVS